jgi:hypothetical protein
MRTLDVTAAEQLNGDSLARRLRRETLGLRVVATTMRIAIRDLDRLSPSADHDEWAKRLAGWIEGVLAYHRGRIRLMREEIEDSSDPDDGEATLRTLYESLQRALADAEATGTDARQRLPHE